MKTMPASEFKAKCIAILKRVHQTGEPVVVTRRGQPVARVEGVASTKPAKRLGALQGSLRIRKDLVRSDTSRDWEMLR